LSSETKSRRLQWILASFLLFFGIFGASMAGPIPSHVPQCAGARAIGARTSLASAARESRPVSVQAATLFVAAVLLLNVFGVQLRRARRVTPAIQAIVRSLLWSPSLLFRPPPSVSLA
jgi:hypothetical protein